MAWLFPLLEIEVTAPFRSTLTSRPKALDVSVELFFCPVWKDIK